MPLSRQPSPGTGVQRSGPGKEQRLDSDMDLLTASYAQVEDDAEGSSPPQLAWDQRGQPGNGQEGGGDETGAVEEEDDDEEIRFLVPTTSAAPPVSDALLASKPSDVMSAPVDPSQRKLAFNPKYEQLWAPLEGPAHPHTKDGRALGFRNHRLGSVQDAAVDSFVFDEQFNTFQALGYGVDPASYGGEALVGDLSARGAEEGATVYNLGQQQQRKRKQERKEKLRAAVEEGKKRGAERAGGEEAGEPGEGEGGGGRGGAEQEGDAEMRAEEEEEEEEAAGEGEGADRVQDPTSAEWLLQNARSPWSGRVPESRAALTEEQRKYKEEHEAKKEKKQRGEKVEEEEKSTFHGKEETDYQGRSWLAPPKDAKAENEHCYIPKRWIHTWSGHTKGVAAIRFFPGTGHLLLSGSMDTKIKIWDVQGSKKCMRTYMGHSKAVKDISFNNDGTRFLSSSYDRNIKLWDTETGKVISTFSTGKIPYVVRLHPDADKQNILMAGMSDKKIIQWDTNSGEITQDYDQHLGAVNTITFFDDNRRFVTSSDDKSLRVWEFGIPVVVKYISEPHMHSMPAITMHPNKHWLAAQSLDNQILIYGTKDRFRLNRKKRFAGHIIAGYACQIGFSPDGRFIMSGDGEGRLWFWDWKTCKVFRTLKCHESVCIGCEWHPLEQSKVATCGWDGLIKYWD